MPTLYIVNPDGPGVYSWTFKRVPWFEAALSSWPENESAWPVWAGFLRGVQIQIDRQVRLARALEPAVYEPPDAED